MEPTLQSGQFGLPATDRGRELSERYALGEWREALLHRRTLDAVLGYLDLLDRARRSELFDPARLPIDPIRILDVGAHTWRYLGALAAWAQAFQKSRPGRSVYIEGLEIDADRLLPNLRTPRSLGSRFAQAFSRPKIHCRYATGDICDWQGQADWVTWFFPFVSPGPLKAWGLGRGRFRPEQAFGRVESILSPTGALLVVNQGEWEWEETRALLGRCDGKLVLRYQEVVEGSLHPSTHPLFVTVWTKR